MPSDRLAAKGQIEKLVKFFGDNFYQFKSPSFNETQARQQLIDPLFTALGWDVHNHAMKPLYLQEVIPEGRLKTDVGREVKEQTKLFASEETLTAAHKEYASILDYIAEDEYRASAKEATKKPDYRFRIKGQTKFFVEAKKPCVDLAKNQDAIFQIKRYGFSGRVPVSILTDFEEFRVFDCTNRPRFDKPKLGVLKEFDLQYTQYLDQFDHLFDTFSRDAIEAGSLDTLTKNLLQKRSGDFALDKEFLEDLSSWREELARDIAKHPRNRARLTDFTLNESVQRILDRIVFLRVCEDREIEVENTLLAILHMWQGRKGISLYSLLNELFKQRRSLYNGLLFAPHACEDLEVGNDVLVKILQNLNYPFSPYHFSEIGVEILGSIYEKFLGKTIHLTAKTTRIEEKPEVRKAGGVYYTPQYIVNYIVDNTLGKMLFDEPVATASPGAPHLKLSPKEVAKLKIIDIACGSGSFLLGAFQKLIDYHTEWYTVRPKDIQTVNNVPDAYLDVNGNVHVSPRKKRDILVNNIYGVDIDRQAVEVTQMSLYLKVLEGENAETLNPQMTLALKEVYLPSMTDNIKCGNSLIGTDFASQEDMFGDDTRQKINPFDWDVEFAEIMKSGGFDVVLGNPPYGADITGLQTAYLGAMYKTANYQIDTYPIFVEKSLTVLKKNAVCGFIMPSAWVASEFGLPFRRLLAGRTKVDSIVVAPRKAFENATVETLIVIFENAVVSKNAFSIIRWDLPDQKGYSIFQENILEDEALIFPVYVPPHILTVVRKIRKQGRPLSLFAEVVWGVKIYQKGKGKPKQTAKEVTAQAFHSKRAKKKTHKPLLGGKEICRYCLKWQGEYVDYGPWLAEPRAPHWFSGKRLLVREVTTNGAIQATMTDEDFVFSNSVDGIKLKDDSNDEKFILAILNSKLISFLHIYTSANAFKESFPKVLLKDLLTIPIIGIKSPSEKKQHDDLASLVDNMLKLNKDLQGKVFDSEREPLERQIAATDAKIDQLVYQLYGLTKEEIKIVEGKG
ncbi:MAG: N-6 DNA methylase [Ignavibacteriales bacterium]|nr:N-6 DNA methylase [Ignavibacteriales bacterium]